MSTCKNAKECHFTANLLKIKMDTWSVNLNHFAGGEMNSCASQCKCVHLGLSYVQQHHSFCDLLNVYIMRNAQPWYKYDIPLGC